MQATKRGAHLTAEACWTAYKQHCRDNLHIVLAMSPVGEKLRTRCRDFPGLASSTVINWFQPWPEQALHTVATALLSVRRALTQEITATDFAAWPVRCMLSENLVISAR